MTKAEEKRREKARLLRYRKPAVKDLNMWSIREQLTEIMEACDEVRYWFDAEDGYNTILCALDGEDDDAHEFKTAFVTLYDDCERMYNDLDETWIPDRFDLFFVGIQAGSETGDTWGFDEYESDYFPLSRFDTEAAERDAQRTLANLTKKELIDTAQVCFRVAFTFLALRSRYDDLKAAMDILREQNRALLDSIAEIEQAYDKADAAGWYEWDPDVKAFAVLTNNMPDRVWIE